ncbi:hypothetical protein [Hydrogenimonas sp.]
MMIPKYKYEEEQRLKKELARFLFWEAPIDLLKFASRLWFWILTYAVIRCFD